MNIPAYTSLRYVKNPDGNDRLGIQAKPTAAKRVNFEECRQEAENS